MKNSPSENRWILFFLFFLSFYIIPPPVAAQIIPVNTLIPTYHWNYEYCQELRVRGYFQSVNFSHLPYLTRTLQSALTEISSPGSTGLILKEHLVHSILLQPVPSSSPGRFFTQLFLFNDLGRPDSRAPWVNRFLPRGRIGFQYGEKLTVINTILVDNRLDENPRYLGKRQSGVASYSEEAYILYTPDHFNFLLGRSFVRWGPGQTGTLLLSDRSRPLDQLYADFHYRWLRFSFVTATLNTRSDSGIVANRYFSAHRLDIHPIKNLWLGISEAILYGGEKKAPELPYHNPFLFFHGVNLNGPTGGNTLGSIDCSYYPMRNLHVYGDLLIDDMQLEKTGPGDLEPPEWGFMLGAQWAIQRFYFQAEYIRITNRTYKTAYFWERYTQRNQPLGYYLGNDFDHLWLRGRCWLTSSLRLQIQLQYIRQGEGSIDTPFDTPWMNTPIGQNYSEPFPTGVVEKTRRFQFQIRWHPVQSFGFFEGTLGQERILNDGNVVGRTVSNRYVHLALWLEVGRIWGL